MGPWDRIRGRQAGDGVGVVGGLGIVLQRRRDLREAVGVEPVAALAEQVVAKPCEVDLDVDRHRIDEGRFEELRHRGDGGLELRRRVGDVCAVGDIENHRGHSTVALPAIVS
jgi:hypothetical protein